MEDLNVSSQESTSLEEEIKQTRKALGYYMSCADRAVVEGEVIRGRVLVPYEFLDNLQKLLFSCTERMDMLGSHLESSLTQLREDVRR